MRLNKKDDVGSGQMQAISRQIIGNSDRIRPLPVRPAAWLIPYSGQPGFQRGAQAAKVALHLGRNQAIVEQRFYQTGCGAVSGRSPTIFAANGFHRALESITGIGYSLFIVPLAVMPVGIHELLLRTRKIRVTQQGYSGIYRLSVQILRVDLHYAAVLILVSDGMLAKAVINLAHSVTNKEVVILSNIEPKLNQTQNLVNILLIK